MNREHGKKEKERKGYSTNRRLFLRMRGEEGGSLTRRRMNQKEKIAQEREGVTYRTRYDEQNRTDEQYVIT